jgi:hypothetical protein
LLFLPGLTDRFYATEELLFETIVKFTVMRKKTIFGILIYFFLVQPSQAQYCSSCMYKPKVVIYDLDVQVPKPDAEGELKNWNQLSQLSEFIRNYFSINDRTCATFIHPLSFQSETTNLGNENLCRRADYFITGTIRQEGKGYQLRLELQTSCSKKLVQSAELSLDASADSGYLHGIARQVCSRMMPLGEKISSYAIKLRKEDQNTALSDFALNTISLQLKEENLKEGEETEIEISLTDCDGTVLANRKLNFSSEIVDGKTIAGTTGGTITPEQVTTNAFGKAKVKFKMGEKSAVIKAHCVYNKPCGGIGVMRGTKRVSNNLRVVNVSIMWEKHEQTTNDISAWLGPLLRGKEEVITVDQSYYCEMDHLTTEIKNGFLVLAAPGLDLKKSVSIYYDQFGDYHYKDVKPRVMLENDQGLKVHEELQKDSVDEVNSEMADTSEQWMTFFIGNENEPMRFDISLNFPNPNKEDEGGLRSEASLNLTKTTPNTTFTVKNINIDGYKKEYVINHWDQDLGDMEELNKLNGTHLPRLEGPIRYTGMEAIHVVIRTR